MAQLQNQTDVGVLFVCTANICRSPVAEHLLRARLESAGRFGLTVISRGLWAEAGLPMDPVMAGLLASEGIQPSLFAAQRLSVEEVAGADLVLTATMQHRSSVVQLYPPAISKVFTLLEFSHLVDTKHSVSDDECAVPRDAKDYAALAARRRSSGATLDLPNLDIPDPYRRSQRTYQRVYSLISAAIEPISEGLAISPRAEDV